MPSKANSRNRCAYVSNNPTSPRLVFRVLRHFPLPLQVPQLQKAEAGSAALFVNAAAFLRLMVKGRRDREQLCATYQVIANHPLIPSLSKEGSSITPGFPPYLQP